MAAGKLPAVLRLVAIDATGGPGFVDALRRTWDEGDAVLPVDPRLPAPARDALLRSVGVGQPVESGDAVVVATSGTTGEPKGVVLTHDALATSAHATSDRLRVEPARDRWLACLPLAHIGGLSVVTRALVTGTALTVHDGFDARAVEAAAHDGATLVSLVTTAMRRIDPSLFRVIVLGGSAPPSDVPKNAVTTYGMTETGSGVVYDGLPLHGVEVRIDNAEILLRGPMLLRCYRSDGAETDPKRADGWFATGDAGYLDDDGHLVVHGRMAEVVVTGGEKVWPEPVEAVLRAHPAVADAAVTGRDDEEWGQRVVAFVVPAKGSAAPTLNELRELVKETLPAYCAPRELVLVESLPRTAIGKVRRRAL